MEEHRETRTSSPVYNLPFISESCAENTPLETENILLKKRQKCLGVGSRRNRKDTSRKEKGQHSVGRAVLGLVPVSFTLPGGEGSGGGPQP